MTITSTYDHRIIQGAESGRFLQRIERAPAPARTTSMPMRSPRWAHAPPT